MKTAVIGCGGVSAMHFIALSRLEDVEVSAVADIIPERADEKAEACNAKAYYDFDELLANEKPDVIHICTPHYLHTPMAVKALRNGINVFLEKPCSVSFDEIEELKRAQSESGKQLGICFQNRYNACVIEAKKIIDSGSMGKLLSARAILTWFRDEEYYSDDWHGTLEKECGGVMINQAIHTLDLLQYLAGKCVKINGHIFNDHLKGVIEVEDTATLQMELEGGVKALMYATTAYAENSGVMIEFALEKGKIRIDDEKLYIIDEKGNLINATEKAEASCVGKSYWGIGHNIIIEDFYNCLKTGEKFKIDAFEGSAAMKTVLSCYASSKENKTVEINQN